MLSNLFSICRLCRVTAGRKPLKSDNGREYLLCTNCKLISLHPQYFLSREKEIERYLTHNNGLHNEGYVEFLNRAIKPALKYINKEMQGLDYGCGPTPTLSKLLKNEGYDCGDYDPLFVENPLNKKYDYIFSTEVFEHFFDPQEEIRKIYDLLNTDGILIVMTEHWKAPENFSRWYYIKDPSHTAFYNASTFEHICETFGFEKIYDDENRVIILKKIP